jgi:dihydroorotate dehydrogenase (NAD+) catalytic subunit
MEYDTKVNLSGWELDNPIIPASGCFGYGHEFQEKGFYDINKLGSFSFKGTTRNPQKGNPLPRVAEYDSGMINSVGLENPGIELVISEELPKLSQVYNKKVIANISGNSIEDYVYNCSLIDKCPQVGIIEVNVSCPNVHGGSLPFGSDPKVVETVTKAIKNVTTKPIYIKLTPNVTNIVDIAVAAVSGGADGIVLINTLQGMRIDLNTKRPILSKTMGGCSGPAVFPIAERMVYQVYDNVNVPIIGVGGINSAEKVIEMMLAGATAVEIGTANLTNPMACSEIIDELPEVMEKYHIKSLKKIIGGAHNG